MRAYTIRRLLLIIPTLFLLTILVFLSVRFIPGDIIDLMVDEMQWVFGNFDREALERMLGLDVPVHVQYGRWMGGILLHGTLGDTLLGGWTVEEKILGRLPVTLELGVMSIVIGLVIALPVGIYSAIRQDTAADYVGRSIAIIGLAKPNFWLGIMVMLYPSIWWNWSPPMKLIPFTEDPLGNLAIGCSSLAALSFLGFGLPLSTPDWGGLLSREGRRYMEQAPHLALLPGLVLTITVYSLNMFGDAVRDLLDPRLRGGGGRLGADGATSV